MVGAPTGTVTLAQANQGDYRAAGKPVLDTVRPAHDTGDHGSTLSGLAWFACIFAVLGEAEPALVSAAARVPASRKLVR
jgi:hypothetical protein